MHHDPGTGRRRTLRRVLPAAVTLLCLVATSLWDYTVQPGDTLSGIAAANGVSPIDLAAANGITDANRILIGSRLKIPGTERVHVVAAGESLTVIAQRYGVTPTALVASNGLRDANRILIGQQLRVEGASGAPVAVTVAAPATTSLSRAEVGVLLERTAREYGFNPAFIKGVAMTESSWRQEARSSVGAIGLMQVMPGTGEFVSKWLVGRPLNLNNAEDNVEAGVAFLNYLWKLTGGDTRMTLAGYYQGLRSVRDRGMGADTLVYIDRVLANRARF